MFWAGVLDDMLQRYQGCQHHGNHTGNHQAGRLRSCQTSLERKHSVHQTRIHCYWLHTPLSVLLNPRTACCVVLCGLISVGTSISVIVICIIVNLFAISMLSVGSGWGCCHQAWLYEGVPCKTSYRCWFHCEI